MLKLLNSSVSTLGRANQEFSTHKIYIQQVHCLPVAHFPGVTQSHSLPLRTHGTYLVYSCLLVT